MPRWLDRLAVRALPGTGAGLGMAINPTTGPGKVKAATVSSQYVATGQPMPLAWDAQLAANAFQSHTYVMRCVRLRADTIAGLPFCAGPDPDDPSVTTSGAPLGRFLGPATPQEPGGPNPTTTARALWAWSIVQRVVTGRMAWELQLDANDPQADIVGIWPLVSAALNPIVSPPGTARWWDSFEYQTPIGVRPLQLHQVFYGWRPSVDDWRQPESALKAARLPIDIATGCDRYMWGLLKNGMVSPKIVIAPPFEDPADERAWEEQFFAEFCGFDNAGKTIFAYAENDYDSNGKLVDQANVQVVDLSMKSVDAQLLELVREAKNDICIALGVARSLLGDASQRIYANADAEYRNFWTTTAINDITEVQDDVNLMLAPRLGPDVGWFDLSRVAALQPPTIFQPPALKDAIDEGVVSPHQAADLLGIPASSAIGEDTDTAPIGEEAAANGSATGSGSRVMRLHGVGSEALRAPTGWLWRHRPVNSHTYKNGTAGWGLIRQPRERITAAGIRAGMHRQPATRPPLADAVLARAASIRARRELGVRASKGPKVAGIAVKAADTGRVLMLQRSIHDDRDPARGKWEFPGGHIEPGEDSFDAAKREWQEEVGVHLPDGNVAGSWTSPNGIYRGHVVVVPSEADLKLNLHRPLVKNPDNPGRKYTETAAWHDPDDIAANPSVRDEVRASADTWLPVLHAAQIAGKRALADDDLDRIGDLVTAALEEVA